MSVATKELADLCRVLLIDTYGELAANIVGVLVNRGCLDVPQLVKELGIPQASVTRTLVALVQNRFVLFWERDKKTFYYANSSAIYTILWSGSILLETSQRYSSDSGADALIPEIVKNMDVYGHMRSGDFIEAYAPEFQEDAKLGLSKLVNDQILSPLKDFEFWPQHELRERMYQKHLTRLTGDKSAPTSEAARKALAEREAEVELNELIKTKYETADKIRAAAANSHSRRQNGGNLLMGLGGVGAGAAVSSSLLQVPPETVLTIDIDKFLVIARNEALVNIVAKRIGTVTSRVYAAALGCYEKLLHNCKEDIHPSVEYNITTYDIAKRLGTEGVVTSAMLEGAIVNATFGKRGYDSSDPYARSKKARTNGGGSGVMDDYINEYGDDDENDDLENESGGIFGQSSGISPGLVTQHLQLLADSDIRFLQNAGNKGGGEWFVPFKQLLEDVKKVTYDEIIENKYGNIATRILRVVREKGKVDEKMMTQVALIPAKDIRSNLTDLQNIGCLELQEIPRGADRAPGRTFYLWFHRPHRAYSLLIEDLYRSMTRIYTRILAERQSHAVLNSKLQREDVQGHEDELLSASEQAELRKMKLDEERLVAQLLRIDALVRIFRDY